MLITYANSLNPDQARQNVGPDLDPSRMLFDTLMLIVKEYFEKSNIEKCLQTTIKSRKITQHAKS